MKPNNLSHPHDEHEPQSQSPTASASYELASGTSLAGVRKTVSEGTGGAVRSCAALVRTTSKPASTASAKRGIDIILPLVSSADARRCHPHTSTDQLTSAAPRQAVRNSAPTPGKGSSMMRIGALVTVASRRQSILYARPATVRRRNFRSHRTKQGHIRQPLESMSAAGERFGTDSHNIAALPSAFAATFPDSYARKYGVRREMRWVHSRHGRRVSRPRPRGTPAGHYYHTPCETRVKIRPRRRLCARSAPTGSRSCR